MGGMSTDQAALLPASGQDAPPRDNGELVFTEPWEATAFGVAVALSDQGSYTWEHFRQRLMSAIAASDGCEAYYESWTKALETSVIDAGLISESDVRARMDSLLHHHHS